jgi:very-short-patch-repair endonuclease
MIAVADISSFMAGKHPPPQRVLARIATRQHGVVSRSQIEALGVDAGFAERSAGAGRLHRVHHGVYAVGHAALTREARWMSAVLAAGEGAVLSHLSAALLWGIVDRAGVVIHVLAADGGSRARPGLGIHRTRHLPPEHRTERDGIPVTTVARTLLDLAALLSAKRLRYAVEAADRNGVLDVPALVALCDASSGRKGTGVLRRLALEQRGAFHRTKSPPESAFLRLCANHGLPEPLVNSYLHGYEVDFYWPRARLAVEVDSYTYHRSWAQRQRDLERDADLKVRGEEVVRFTRERVEGAAGVVAAQLAALLELRTARAV